MISSLPSANLNVFQEPLPPDSRVMSCAHHWVTLDTCNKIMVDNKFAEVPISHHISTVCVAINCVL